MPGLGPGIRVFVESDSKDVDGRDRPGHDGWTSARCPLLAYDMD